jgi:uncharacterized membrane protein YhhN
MARLGVDLMYWAIAAVVLTSTFFPEFPMLHYCSKPLLMPMLFLLLLPLKSKLIKLCAVAVWLSWLGDVFLMLNEDLVPSVDQESWFIFGLGAFLLAHLFYIWTFTQVHKGTHQVPVIKKYPLIMFGYIGIAAFIFIKLTPDLGDMVIPVFLYTAAILMLLLIGTNRYGRVSQKSFLAVLLGVWLFTLSDSLIAFNKFSEEIPLASFWIMLTYATAQWLIVKGVVKGKDV